MDVNLNRGDYFKNSRDIFAFAETPHGSGKTLQEIQGMPVFLTSATNTWNQRPSDSFTNSVQREMTDLHSD